VTQNNRFSARYNELQSILQRQSIDEKSFFNRFKILPQPAEKIMLSIIFNFKHLKQLFF